MPVGSAPPPALLLSKGLTGREGWREEEEEEVEEVGRGALMEVCRAGRD